MCSLPPRTQQDFKQVALSTSAYPPCTQRRDGKLSGLGGTLHLACRCKECGAATNDLVRKVVATNSSLRAVILTASHTAHDILSAFVAGASGFLRQDIPSKQLIKSLELIALGESVMHPHFQQMALTSPAGPSIEQRELSAEGDGKTSIRLLPPRLEDFRSAISLSANEQSIPENAIGG